MEGHNIFAAAHNDLARHHEMLAERHRELVESHDRVMALAVELARQLVEQRQVRAADVEETVKVLQ